jgi:hypothetical protein
MSNTADVTGGKPIAVCSQSISSVNSINPSVAFYDIHGRKREMRFYSSVPNNTWDLHILQIDKCSAHGQLVPDTRSILGHGSSQ